MRASLYSAEPQDYKSVTMLPAALLTQLRTAVGSDGVIDRPEALLVYECDGHTLERAAPEVVGLPRTPAEVAAVLRLLAAERIPFVPRGAGTGLSGGTLPVEAPVMVGTSRLSAIEAIDVANRRIVAQAGVVNQWVTNSVRAHGLCFAPDPSSQPACTIGGNIAENSGGPHTLKYGVTTNHVLGVELVLASGEVVALGGAVEDRPGYDLVGLVVGAEGTFGIVTRATLRLVRAPEAFRTLLAVFESVDAASEAVSGIIAAGIVPAALEMMDRLILQALEQAYHIGLPTDAGAVLLIELDEVRRVLAAGREILEACVALGGSLTGEHGIGVEKMAQMPLLFGPDDLRAMTRLRAVFDPEGRANPHKIFPDAKVCVETRAPRRQAAM